MGQIDRLANGEIYLRLTSGADYNYIMEKLDTLGVTWATGDKPSSLNVYQIGIVLCCDNGILSWSHTSSGEVGGIPIENYVGCAYIKTNYDFPKDKSGKVGRTKVVDYVDKLIDYTPIQGDRYRFELYDYEYILAHVGGQEFNLINIVTGNLLTSDSFEFPKYGIDLIKYAGSAITHVNGNKII